MKSASTTLSRAMALALERDVGLRDGERFAVVTHSTGGPVVRLWWHMFYLRTGRRCPMSHLVMLAPANFGSALAQIGKGWAGGLRAFFHGVEPGRGVLDWLELGSPEAWELNREWICRRDWNSGDRPVFPFVLTGQRIDRKLYDHLNSYTGETGSGRKAEYHHPPCSMVVIRVVDDRGFPVPDYRLLLTGAEYTELGGGKFIRFPSSAEGRTKGRGQRG